MKRKFYRDISEDSSFGGVISGAIKSYNLDVDISIARFIIVFISIITNVPFLLTYIILYLVLPEKEFDTFEKMEDDEFVDSDACACGGNCKCETEK